MNAVGSSDLLTENELSTEFEKLLVDYGVKVNTNGFLTLDSLNLVELMLAIENKFSIDIPSDFVMDFKSKKVSSIVDELYGLIRR